MHQILALWAHPRSLSTVLERIVIERGDFEVMHEPFSRLYYLREQRSAVHASLSADRPADYASIRAEILRTAEDRPVCFKDMCYHCHDYLIHDEAFLCRTTNVFLVRDPTPTIASHFAKNPNVTLEEIGYEKQANIFRKTTALRGASPVVISAEELQENPAEVTRALWKNIGVKDLPKALRWKPGHRPEWDDWQEWHREVSLSCQIHQQRQDYPDTVRNHSELTTFDNHHRPYYDEMYRHRVRAS